MHLRTLLLPVAVLGIIGLIGCGSGSKTSGGPPPTLASIAVTPASPTVAPGSSVQLKATGTYSDQSTKDLTSSATWTVDQSSIATVSAGNVTGVAPGTAKITATSGSVSGSTSVTVALQLVSITLTPVGPAVTTAGSVQLTATGTYSDKSTKDLTSSATWTVDQSSIATVSAGKVNGVAPGVATITATSGSVSGSTPVHVTSQNVATNALSGSYAFVLKTIDSRGQAVVVGSFTSDGNGNITSGIADYNMASGVSSTGAVNLTASTYTLMPDGRGEADIKFNSQSFHVAFVLSDFSSGTASKGKMISFDTSKAFGEFELQTAGQNLTASSNYVFGFNGLDSSNKPEAEIGLFNTGTLGTACTTAPSCGSYDVDDSGTIDASAAAPGPATAPTFSTVTVNPVSTPGNRGTATLGSATYAYYTINASKAYFIENDTSAGTALAGTAELQTATVNNTTLHFIEPLTPEDSAVDCGPTPALEPYCNYAFLLEHAANAQNGTFEKAGQIDLCPCALGGINFDREDDAVDGKDWGIGTGTRGFSAIGRGLFTYPVINGSGNRYAIVYVVSNTLGSGTTTGSSRFYMMNTDTGANSDGSPGIGVADFINGVPTAVPSAGSYAFSATSIGSTSLLELGVASFSGSNVTGIAYVNNNGSLSIEAVSGTFTPSSNTNITSGDGKGTISPFNSTTSSLGVYSVGSQGLILLDPTTNINGRMEPQ
jgi:uncharacterized protein YjdB